jgi:ATP-dependent RNA helicase DDX46/PRP5
MKKLAPAACMPDDTGAAITTRGSFYPPGKEAGADKLHLLVEAPDQMALTKAKGEIKRIVGASTTLALPWRFSPSRSSRFSFSEPFLAVF